MFVERYCDTDFLFVWGRKRIQNDIRTALKLLRGMRDTEG